MKILWVPSERIATSPSGRVCRQLPSVMASSPASTRPFSRSFQIASSSAEGAVPMRPAAQQCRDAGNAGDQVDQNVTKSCM